jgi:hypothetical protein
MASAARPPSAGEKTVATTVEWQKREATHHSRVQQLEQFRVRHQRRTRRQLGLSPVQRLELCYQRLLAQGHTMALQPMYDPQDHPVDRYCYCRWCHRRLKRQCQQVQQQLEQQREQQREQPRYHQVNHEVRGDRRMRRLPTDQSVDHQPIGLVWFDNIAFN